MQICILGAGGFVGARLVAWLLENSQHHVVGIDVDHGGVSHLLSESRFSYYESDPRADPDLLTSFIRRANLVVNLLSLADGNGTGGDPSRLVERGIRSDLRIARCCVEHGTRLIQWSPTESLEPRTPAASELLRDLEADLPMSLRPGAIDDPRWLPVACRELTERVLYAYGDADMLDFTIVRPSDMLGSAPNESSLEGSYRSLRRFDEVLAAALVASKPTMGEGANGAAPPAPSGSRSYIHVEDVVELIGRIILDDSGRASGQLYHAGNPANQSSDGDLARLIGELYAEIIAPDHPVREASDGDAGNSSSAPGISSLTNAVASFGTETTSPGLDITRAAEDFDWFPRYSLPEAVIEAMDGDPDRLRPLRLPTSAQ